MGAECNLTMCPCTGSVHDPGCAFSNTIGVATPLVPYVEPTGFWSASNFNFQFAGTPTALDRLQALATRLEMKVFMSFDDDEERWTARLGPCYVSKYYSPESAASDLLDALQARGAGKPQGA